MDDEARLRALLGEREGGDAELRRRDERTYLVLRNEFATVWIGLDRDHNGVRLLLTDAETGTHVALDPLELEAISRFSHCDFDAWILERSAPRERDGASPTVTHHDDGHDT